MVMKNVFIEGIQGMGKSTLLNSLIHKIPELHICREGDYSPVELAWCTWMTKEDYNRILKHYEALREEIIKNTFQEGDHYIITYTKILTDIPNFHKELETFEIYNGRTALDTLKEIVCSRYQNFSGAGYLFECSFFQNIIEDLILFHQLRDDEIMDFYQKLYSMINKDSFLLLYLNSDKLEENIMAIKKERCDELGNELWYSMMLEYLVQSPYGKQHGFTGLPDMLNHFKHRQQLELRIINEIIGDRAVILPAKSWDIEGIIALIS